MTLPNDWMKAVCRLADPARSHTCCTSEAPARARRASGGSDPDASGNWGADKSWLDGWSTLPQHMCCKTAEGRGHWTPLVEIPRIPLTRPNSTAKLAMEVDGGVAGRTDKLPEAALRMASNLPKLGRNTSGRIRTNLAEIKPQSSIGRARPDVFKAVPQSWPKPTQRRDKLGRSLGGDFP